MKRFTVMVVLLMLTIETVAQRIESIYVNLYTDSLKKGTYNYINIEGRTKDGSIFPLDSNHIIFTSNNGEFFGNSLWLEQTCTSDSIRITATLKERTSESTTFTVFIKKNEDDEELPTELDILKPTRKKRRD